MGHTLFGAPRDVVDRVLTPARREAVRCPICDAEPVRFGTDYQGFHLARCRRCDLQFQSPRPSFDDLAAHVYTEAYHSPEERTATPRQARHFTRQLATLRRSLPRGGRLLDVGAGAGAFLRFARERGWNVAGTDVVASPQARDGTLLLFEGALAAIDFGDQRFDAIRFNHVLEHTPNPVAELRRARELLDEGGVVLVAVPNLRGLSAVIKSAQSRLAMKRHIWRHYAALHHLWYFTPRTLGRVFEAAGYRVLAWETPAEASNRASIAGTLLARLKAGSVLEMYATPRQPS